MAERTLRQLSAPVKRLEALVNRIEGYVASISYREFIVIFVLIVLSLLFAGFIHLAELGHESADHRNEKYPGGCLGRHDFAAALFFVNTIHTTIGYGNVYPCSEWGRALTCLYAIVAIPLVVLVLDKIGNIFESVIETAWNSVQERVSRSVYELPMFGRPGRAKVTAREEYSSAIVYLGILLAWLWLLVCAGYFSAAGEWSFADSLYFVVITMTTCGLGDFAPSNFEMPHFFFIFLGLSLFATSVKLFQARLEQICVRIQQRVFDDFKSRQLRGEEANVDAPGRQEFDGVLHEQSWLVKLMPVKQQKRLANEFERLARMRVVGVQTGLETCEAATGSDICAFDRESQTSWRRRDVAMNVRFLPGNQKAVQATAFSADRGTQTVDVLYHDRRADAGPQARRWNHVEWPPQRHDVT